MSKTLPLSKLTRDPRLQSRAKGLDENHVAEIAAAIKNRKSIDPVRVCSDPDGKYCYDGWHRVAAFELCGYTDIPATIENGSIEDAIERAAAANITHGLKRTNDDKRRAIELLLSLSSWADKSNRAIADQAGVGDQLVSIVRESQLRESRSSNDETEQKTVVRVGKDGRKRKVKTSKSTTKKVSKKAAKETEIQSEAVDPNDPHEAVNSFLRSISTRVKTAETTVFDLSEELGKWNSQGGSKKLPTASGLVGSLRSAVTNLKAVAAALRDAVSAPGPCIDCNGKGGPCKGCDGAGYQSTSERRQSENMRTAKAPRGVSA